jgi:lipopolysaccharide transport system permease protein
VADTLTVYDSDRRAPPMIEELIQALRYRDLIRQLVRRDVLTRYKRSLLGVAWTMLNPLGMMLVLTLAFSNLFGGTRAYPVYVLSGIIVWSFLSQTTTSAMSQLTWGGVLLHRIYLPRTTFAIASVGTGLVNLVFSLVPFALVMAVTGTPVRLTVLILPVSILTLALFALGLGLLLSSLAVYFPDVSEMYQIVLLGWMYLTPIIYPEQIVPEAYRWWMFNLNPMYHIVQLFRLPLYEGIWPSAARLASALIVAVIMAAFGWLVFTHRADEFAYRI